MFLDMSEQEASKSMVINAESHFWITREFLPSMVKRNKGHIVSIASMGAYQGAPGMTDYCASKFAAYGFMEALRLEMKSLKKKIAFTTICPAPINTGMVAGYKSSMLCPMLNYIYVADRIVQAILQEEVDVCMPWIYGVTQPLVKALFTSGFRDKIYEKVMGLDGMNKFKGRTGSNAPLALAGSTGSQAYANDQTRIDVQNQFKS